MKFITLFAGALVATTAVNVLLASDALSDHHDFQGNLPNGWKQVGLSCQEFPVKKWLQSDNLRMLQKNSNKSIYGVWRNNKTWYGSKNLTLAEANAKMNDKCDCASRDCSY